LERDLLTKEVFGTFQEAYDAVETYVNFYNNRRMHQNLGKRSPAAFMQWASAHPDQLAKYIRAV
ncbi:IS3 family transposase, partial [Paenibacillus silvestris]|uniref:IS3 family transposase n=1 Tax=Paenibacillus silvestris TaxID=2606219 RepID=UPI0013735E50